MIRIARPGPRERLAPHHPLGHAELLADAPHLVLEEQAQRLDEAHLHVLRQPADVVVRLDRLGDAVGAARLDHVRVERSLDEPGRIAELARLVLEDADELLADDHALRLGVGHAGELREEPLLRLHMHERHVEDAVEGLHHLLRLALPEQPVVDEDAGQLIADRAMHEQRRDGRVDAARERAQHPGRADLCADALDLLGDHRGGRPDRGDARDLVQEVLQHLLAVRRVHDLGVELHAVEAAPVILERRDRRARRLADDAGAGRGLDDRVAVGHPHRLLGRQVVEEPALGRVELGAAELGDVGAVDTPAELERQQLRAVTDPERRHAELEDRRIEPRRSVRVDRRRPAREDDRGRVAAAELVDRDAVRDELGVDARLAHPPGDQLCVLPAEVDHQHRAILGERLLLIQARQRERDDLTHDGNSARPW